MRVAQQITGVRRGRTGFVPRSGLRPADLSDEVILDFNADDEGDSFEEDGMATEDEWSPIDSFGEYEV